MTVNRDPLTQDAQRVDADGWALTRSKSRLEGTFENSKGNAYNLNTGDVTLTTATASAVAYLKNNESSDLVIDSIITIFGASTGGSGNLPVVIYRNPTGGDIVDNAVTGTTESNRNYGSNNTLAVDFFKGAEGDTITGGSPSITSILQNGGTRVVFSVGTIILPKGSSIGVSYTPATGNTSMIIQCAFQCYLEVLPTPGV